MLKLHLVNQQRRSQNIKAGVAGLHPQLKRDLLEVNINDISHTLALGAASLLRASTPALSGQFDKSEEPVNTLAGRLKWCC